MANKRNLKKYINFYMNQLAFDCMVLSRKDEKTTEELLERIFNLQDEIVGKINKTPKTDVKKYYKELSDYYTVKLQEIADEANK